MWRGEVWEVLLVALCELGQREVVVVGEQVEAVAPDRDRVDGRAGVDGEEVGRHRGDVEREGVVQVEEVSFGEGVVREVHQLGENRNFAP